ncbi:MAG: AraC family transcriptional regulator [Clostridia bacterium]|nr:AraC family transcriptional regulator [Clostridia bacterium]
MSDWTQGMQDALAYIEEHLTDEMNIRAIAAKAYLSPYYFQRIFHALCGVSVAEYVRNRRMALAGEELLSSNARVIDVALKYGYDSPDSFARAFQRFHGVTPSAAQKGGASLRAYAPVRIKLTLEGGSMLEYRIETKPQFTIIGLSRMFSSETSYQDIPQYWLELMKREDAPVCGAFGVCLDEDKGDGQFKYMIADLYQPWKEIPDECEVCVIPGATWVVFPCRGPLPDTLQSVNTRIWSEWLPACRSYRMAMNMNIEVYAPPAERPEDTYSEIWVPVERV